MSSGIVAGRCSDIAGGHNGIVAGRCSGIVAGRSSE